MNILFEEFPDSVCVNGENYQIETDFREWIRFIQLVEDDEVPWQIKCQLMMQWYTDGMPDDLEGAVYALGGFLEMRVDRSDSEEHSESVPKQLYSFEQDADCIYSAFREVYGINLQTVPYMHWWEFRRYLLDFQRRRRSSNGSCTGTQISGISKIRMSVSGSRRYSVRFR